MFARARSEAREGGAMSEAGDSWSLEDCVVEPAVGRDAMRVLHRPTRTAVFIPNVELEHRVRQSIDDVPAAASLDDRRRRVAVRMAWELSQ